MGDYAQKHRKQVFCAYPPCSNTATKLVLIDGKPWWVCDSCAPTTVKG